MVKRRLIGLAAAAALACGCGDEGGATSSMDKATFTGTVRRQGKPVDGGTISFNPANARRRMVPINTAEIGEDGTYKIETLVGSNEVSVHPDGELPGRPRRGSKANRSSVAATGFRARIEAKSGENAYDVNL